MTTREIACDVYARCFDDVFDLSDVLHALEICAEEAAAEATKALQKQIEKLKCCGNCKHMDFTEPNYCVKGVFRERQYVCNKWEAAE